MCAAVWLSVGAERPEDLAEEDTASCRAWIADHLVDASRATPLHLACSYRRVDVCEWLLRESGPAPRACLAVDVFGWTPLARACDQDGPANLAISALLVDAAVQHGTTLKLLGHEAVRRRMSPNVAAHLLQGLEARLVQHAAVRLALFGMHERSGAPHLSRLDGLDELRRIVASFVGDGLSSRVLAELRAATAQLRAMRSLFA